MDTDSVMIEVDDLPKLSESYKQKYGRELIGSNLGQFHSDFPTINNHDETPVSIESYYLMKKMYVHKLVDSTGDEDFMIRAKGVTLSSIKYAAQKSSLMELYDDLFNGQSKIFDLTQGQPCFSMNKDMTVSSKSVFQRTITVKYDEGNRDDYFDDE